MLLKHLKAWISYDTGGPLPEHSIKSSKNKTECWIVSEEGRHFLINWELNRESKIMGPSGNRKKCGITCTPSLDGDQMSTHVLGPKEITPGFTTEISGQHIHEQLYPFLFGRKNIVESNNEANPKAVIKDFNTIRVIFKWLPCYYELETSDELDLDVSSDKEHIVPVVHEKAAKHGHPGSAQLDGLPSSPRENRNSTTSSDNGPKTKYFKYNKNQAKHIRPIEFVFHYGPEEYLKAKGKIDLKKPGPRYSARTAAREAPAPPLPSPSPPPMSHIKKEPKDELKEAFANVLPLDLDDSDIEIVESISERNVSEISSDLSSAPGIEMPNVPPPKVEDHNAVPTEPSSLPVQPSGQSQAGPSTLIGKRRRSPEDSDAQETIRILTLKLEESDNIKRDLTEQLEIKDERIKELGQGLEALTQQHKLMLRRLAGKRRQSPENPDVEDRIRMLTLKLEKANSNERRLTEQIEIKDERIEELLQEMEDLRQQYKLVLRHIGDVEGQPARRTKKRKGNVE
ncbi:hypothetical protein BDV93DRAFT_542257 [Ceratobasidium sp. AG-I]|nr:hypothetical protein BDV93DRAFT_542257 [Ceratobasidium sp. AG-I]